MNVAKIRLSCRSSFIVHPSSFVYSAPVKKLLVAFVVPLALFCGKRGDPKPPVPVIPQATSDLVVAQRAGQVILSWSYPSLTTAGRSLTDVHRIHIYRYVEALPVPAGGTDPNAILPGDIDTTLPRPVALFAKIPTIPQAQFAKLSTRIESIEKANLASATTGAKLIYADAPPFRSSDGRQVRLTYAVVTEGPTAKGDFSNLAIVVPLPVSAPPKDLTATAKAEGVVLTWTAPTTSVTQDPPIIAGYNIYRGAPGEAVGDLATPINTALVTGTTHTDVPPYGEHEYRVTAVASAGPPLLQSDVSLPAKATFRDLIAPPTPASLTPLIETKAVRLVWPAVEAADLAGYKIYRAEGVGHGTNIRDIGTIPIDGGKVFAETGYLDSSVDLGIAYRYAVTSVDKSGNESAKVWTDWVVAPKTP
jgi:hypothetical protein